MSKAILLNDAACMHYDEGFFPGELITSYGVRSGRIHLLLFMIGEVENVAPFRDEKAQLFFGAYHHVGYNNSGVSNRLTPQNLLATEKLANVKRRR